MAEIDPLGEVAQGRDNTGSANIIGPRVRRSYADVFIDEIGKRQSKRAALQGAAQKMLDPGSFKAWDKDLPYMQSLRDNYTQLAVDYEQNIGKDKNLDAVKYNNLLQLKDKMFHAAGASDADRQKYEDYQKIALVNRDKLSPDALKNLEQWANTPFEKRVGTEPQLAAAKTNWMEEYLKTPAVGEKEVGSESPSKTSPGFTNVYKGQQFDEEKSLKKAAQFLTQETSAADAAISDAEKLINADQHLSAQYNATTDPTAKKKMAFAVAQQQLVDLDRSRAKSGGVQSLQPIPKGLQGEGYGLKEMLSQGLVKKEVPRTAVYDGKPGQAQPSAYAMPVIADKETVVPANTEVIDLATNKAVKDAAQYNFKPGSIHIIKVGGEYKPYVFGKTVEYEQNVLGETKPITKNDIAVPFYLVKNVVAEKNPVAWVDEAVKDANDRLKTESHTSSDKIVGGSLVSKWIKNYARKTK